MQSRSISAARVMRKRWATMPCHIQIVEMKMKDFVNSIKPYYIIVIFTLWIGTLLFVQLYLLPNFQSITGQEIIEMSGGYTTSEAYQLFEKYGESGRNYYNLIQVVDIFLPLFMGLFLSSFSLKLLNSAKFKYLSVGLIPLLLVVADYLENVGVFTMLQTFPKEFSNSLVFYTGTITSVKLVLYAVGMLTMAMSLIYWIIVKTKQNKSTAKFS